LGCELQSSAPTANQKKKQIVTVSLEQLYALTGFTMDKADSAFLWAIIGLPSLAAILAYILASRYNELIALHLTVFWSQFFAYGAMWIRTNQLSFRFPGRMMLLLAFELTVYCGVFLILGNSMRKFAQTVSEAALGVRARTILFWIGLSLGFHIYLLSTYGVVALILYAKVAESAGMPSYLNYLNELFSIPAWGAVFCCSVQVAYRRFRIYHLLAIAYVVMHLFVDMGAGKTDVLLVVCVAILFGRQRPFRLSWRAVCGTMTAACLLFVIWNFYESIRSNFRGLLISGGTQNYDSVLDMAGALVNNGGEQKRTLDLLSKDIQGRPAPIYLLTEIAERSHLAEGAFITQGLSNVTPSFFSEKTYRHENEVLSDTMEFPFDDYPWTLLSEMQAEVSALAMVLTPLIYLGLFWIYWYVIDRWRGRSEMLILTAVGIVVFEAGQTHTFLTAVLSHLRAFTIFLSASFVLWHVRTTLRTLNRIANRRVATGVGL
jgi:hypothetical protein